MRRLTLKQKKWFNSFVLTGNKTESAKLAGYRAKSEDSFAAIGYQNFRLLQPEIKKWLDSEGLTDEVILMKIIAGMSAKKVIIRKIKGAVNPNDLPPGYRLITTTGVLSEGGDGERFYSDGDSLIEIELEALETQFRNTSLAAECQGTKENELAKRVSDLEKYMQSERERN